MRRSNEPLDDWDDFDGRRRHAARDALGDLAGIVAGDVGGRIREAPGTFAAVVTFVAMFGFVGANALWHQPHSHANAFYSTRDHAVAPVTEEQAAAIVKRGIIAAREQGLAASEVAPLPAAAPAPVQRAAAEPDPTVLGVQATLKELQLYSGEVDGVMGSRTRQAILAYQAILRLEPTGEIDAALLAHLRAVPETGVAASAVAAAPEADRSGDIVASIVPTPRPDIETPIPAQREIAGPDAGAAAADDIRALQLGLRQFGNPDLDADGKLGPKTQQAIAEFQEVFRLEVTGRPDAAVFREMRRQGFIN